MRNVPSLETVVRDYTPRDVQFIYIYKALAHPETNGYITPFTLEERLLHVREAETRLKSQVTWICDSMENELKHALGDAPNSEFVVGPDGTILRKRVWSRPEELRRDLEQLIGPVEPVTTVDELNMPALTPPQQAATGVVPRVQLPGPLRPLVVQPVVEQDGLPFYMKLRAEGQPSLWERGTGTLYLGFFPDPIHKVHWNNRAAPVRFRIEAPPNVCATPAQGEGPPVEVDGDADPREFLIEVDAAEAEQQRPVTLQLVVDYFACDDAQTFCVPVRQRYTVTLQADPDGGNRRAGRAAGAAGRPAPPAKSIPPGAMMLQRLLQRDANGDGQLSRDEFHRSCNARLNHSMRTAMASCRGRNWSPPSASGCGAEEGSRRRRERMIPRPAAQRL